MTHRYIYASIAAIVAAGTAATLLVLPRPQPFQFHYENVLGTSLDLTVVAASERDAKAVETAVLGQFDRDAQALSGYDAKSEFSEWFRTKDDAVTVSPALYEVLGLFDVWRAKTGGALDASAESVSRVWKTAAGQGRVPTAEELDRAVHRVRETHWALNPVTRTATHTSDAPLMLNSFTKSYIIERAAVAAMAAAPITAVVVNVGGDIVTRGRWTETVALADPLDNADNSAPLAQVALRDRAIATSGGYRRGFDIAGRHYSHIVDPRTGQPTGHVLSATVVAPHAVDAGALATALCVLTPDEGERLAATVPGAEFLIVLADGNRLLSSGWRALESAPSQPWHVPSPIAQLYAFPQTSNPAFELVATVELARQGGFGKRPYLAIWLEDKDRFPIRTLALWFDKNKYLPELRAWFRAERLRSMTEGKQIIPSVSSATRSPGKYTFKWDGKDQQGKVVKPGKYTVNIEVAREHGGYYVMRQEMDFSGVAAHVDLPPNGEISAASLDYRKSAS